VTAEALTHSRETLAHFGATILFLIVQHTLEQPAF